MNSTNGPRYRDPYYRGAAPVHQRRDMRLQQMRTSNQQGVHDQFSLAQQPHDYATQLRELNRMRIRDLDAYSLEVKQLFKKHGRRKWAPGLYTGLGTIMGSAILGGVVGHAVAHSTLAAGATVAAKASAALVAMHFWPLAVLGGCIVAGALFGIWLRHHRYKRIRLKETDGKHLQIKGLRDGLLKKQRKHGLTDEEVEYVKKASKLLSKLHVNPWRALGESVVGAVAALPAAGIAGVAAFVAGEGLGNLGGGGGGGGFSGGGSGGGGSLGDSGLVLSSGSSLPCYWAPYPDFGPGMDLPSMDFRRSRRQTPSGRAPLIQPQQNAALPSATPVVGPSFAAPRPNGMPPDDENTW